MHYKEQTSITFYAVAFLAALILFGGILNLIRLWRLGKAPTLNEEVRPFRWVSAILRASLIETQILEYSNIAWIAHLMIFWGIVALLLQTAIHSLLTWLIPRETAFYRFFEAGSGRAVMAVWGDFWGLILLGGVLIAFLRRCFFRPETLNTISDDWIPLLLLFLIVLSGFFTEAVRLAVRPGENDTVYSFAVNWAVPFLRGYCWPKDILTYLFWVHGGLSLFCVAYIPYSKFRHMIASPLVYAFVTAGNRYSKEVWLKGRKQSVLEKEREK